VCGAVRHEAASCVLTGVGGSKHTGMPPPPPSIVCEMLSWRPPSTERPIIGWDALSWWPPPNERPLIGCEAQSWRLSPIERPPAIPSANDNPRDVSTSTGVEDDLIGRRTSWRSRVLVGIRLLRAGSQGLGFSVLGS